ncbi:zf-HC2 domain-containing protein [Roseateles sp. LKC17W]|uniref:Zf-HC2 domain-containing protein n=1 Tax=Pelomonas margarita TaxID=3299031 RepID=A0ABW7FIC6_9BURK
MSPSPGHDDAGHARVQALMPWVLNGQADAGQQAEVARHLASCTACRDEMAHQQRLQTALQLPAATVPDAEQGLARLLQRIELDGLDEQPRPAPARPHRLSLALAACVALQAVALAVLAPRAWQADDAAYRTLSQATPADTGRLRVLPAPQLSLADWQALLQAEGLQVSSGPNQAGAYALTPVAARTDIPALVTRLRARPELLLVEPMQAAP